MGQGLQNRPSRAGVLGAAVLACASAHAQPGTGSDAPSVEITGHYDNSVGSTDAASAGTITPS